MKKILSRAPAMVLALALALSLCGCSMGLNDMLIVKRAYRQVAEMDSVSFTAAGELDASLASLPMKAALKADCRSIVEPFSLYMDTCIDLGKLGTLEFPAYLFTGEDALQLRIGLGEGDSSLWFSSSIPLPQSGSESSALDVESVLTMLQDDPEALSIGEGETINGVLCRPFTLKIPGAMISQSLGEAGQEKGEAAIDDLLLTIWISEKEGSPVRLSADIASIAAFMLDRADTPLLPGLKINSLPVTVDITGFNNVESIELPDAAA